MAPGGGGGDPSPASTEFSDISMTSPDAAIPISAKKTSTGSSSDKKGGMGKSSVPAIAPSKGPGVAGEKGSSKHGPSKPQYPGAVAKIEGAAAAATAMDGKEEGLAIAGTL